MIHFSIHLIVKYHYFLTFILGNVRLKCKSFVPSDLMVQALLRLRVLTPALASLPHSINVYKYLIQSGLCSQRMTTFIINGQSLFYQRLRFFSHLQTKHLSCVSSHINGHQATKSNSSMKYIRASLYLKTVSMHLSKSRKRLTLQLLFLAKT